MAAKKSTKKPRQVFAFVDTNIFLDFYRDSNEATLSLLERLGPVSNRIISTYQVEMEFLKNRQGVLADAIGKLHQTAAPGVPAILSDSATNQSMRALSAAASDKQTKIKQRILSLLRSPNASDVVFKTLMQIFQSSSSHVLTRDMPVRREIKDLALKRFLLGYPPRKRNDTSFGDALNWEWIIECGKQHQGRILIVSRDSDFGVMTQKQHFLNDQLLREYRDRVGPKRSIGYTTKLSDALAELQVHVPEKEIKAEAEHLEKRADVPLHPIGSAPDTGGFQQLMRQLIDGSIRVET